MSTVITDKKTSHTRLNELEQLKKFTTVVADTADFESIREFKPQDKTPKTQSPPRDDESQSGLRSDAEGELQSFLEDEIKNVTSNPAYAEELKAASGRCISTVAVTRCCSCRRYRNPTNHRRNDRRA